MAQYKIGNCYHEGTGLEKDHEEASKWYRKAAEQAGELDESHTFSEWMIESPYKFGLCFYNGEGVQQDHEEAAKWFLQVAEQGHAEAKCRLGVCCYNGEGVQRDHEEAAKWFLKASKVIPSNAARGLLLQRRRSSARP